jgi:xanthine dehydrogenase molybdenum-binding subunit
MMDKLAETLGMDPVELRRMNALHVGSITNTGQVLRESVGLTECIDRVDAEMRKYSPNPFKPVVEPVSTLPAYPAPNGTGQGDATHWVRAWGVAAAYKNTGLGGGAPDISGADVELYADGTFQVRSSAAELGQGLVTVMRLIVAEEMGVAPEKVSVLVMDTDLAPNGGPTTASRQTFVTGNASRYAAKTLRDQITALMAEKYDVRPEQIRYQDGIVHVNGHSLTYAEIYNEMTALGQQPRVRYMYEAPKTQPLGTGGLRFPSACRLPKWRLIN